MVVPTATKWRCQCGCRMLADWPTMRLQWLVGCRRSDFINGQSLLDCPSFGNCTTPICRVSCASRGIVFDLFSRAAALRCWQLDSTQSSLLEDDRFPLIHKTKCGLNVSRSCSRFCSSSSRWRSTTQIRHLRFIEATIEPKRRG